MTRRARRTWIAASLAVVLLVAGVLGTILVLASDWFSQKIRERIVAEVEKATGGRTEIGAFRFDWKQLRAEVDGFVLHGNEPTDGPPLLRADAIAVGIKVISVPPRAMDIQYLDVRRPQVYLIVYPDGRTNVPAPKVKRLGKGTLETILDLAVGRYSLQDGSFTVRNRGRTPFAAQGRNLQAQFRYDFAGLRYRGQVSVASTAVRWGDYGPTPLEVRLELAVERDRVQIHAGRLATSQSQAEFAGAIGNLADPAGSFQYKVHASLGEVARTLGWRTQLDGPVALTGNLRFQGIARYWATGSLIATGLRFRPDPRLTLSGFRADGSFEADSSGVAVHGMHISGTVEAMSRMAVSGRIATVTLRERILDAAGIRLEMLGGSFQGQARLADFARARVEGEITAMDARQMLEFYNGQHVPWDGMIAGPLELSATLGQARTLHLQTHAAISPAPQGAPVRGAVEARYEGATETLDLARSWLALPATRVDFSGVLGRQLQLRVDSRNPDEVLPAFEIKALPIKLENGEAKFEGTVIGTLEDPRVSGHGNVTHLNWAGHRIDAASGDMDLTRAGLALHNGHVRRGGMEVQGEAALGMQDWKVAASSPISAAGTVRDADAADLMALAEIQHIPLRGTVGADGKVWGTFSAPQVAASFTVTKGTLKGEPFDRIAGAAGYSGATAELSDVQISAGAKLVTLQASYQHQPGNFSNGRLRVQVHSNAMPLAQFDKVLQAYPGIGGTAELHATGLVDVAAAKPGQPAFDLASLNGALYARGLRINDQPFRDVNLTATTKGTDLEARFDSELAGSAVHGEGSWRLAGDYPGRAQISFKGLDLERLRTWLRGSKLPGGFQITGSAEGTLVLEGPAIDPDRWKAQLRVPTLRVGPGGELAAQGRILALHNPEPMVVKMERGVIHVVSARLVGRATDLSLSGTVSLQQHGNPMDLRVNGRFDLASLQDFNRDIYGSGGIQTAVTIRGPLAQPQVAGRLDIKDAAFNLAEIPVGIYKANGVVLFDASRATIQSFSGESGGGTVTLSGFAGYSGDTLAFHLHANARELRVRYPEDFSTVADASMSLTGASDSSTLSGRVTVLRVGFNPRSDFSSLLAKSAQPVRTPAAHTGLLGNMHLDVQIESAPDLTFQSSLAQGLEAEASLRLRGTASNPSLLGRINVTQGQIVFFGTSFTIDQGSIGFYNPVKLEPVVNVDLDTKARGIDVTLNISGTINKLNMTPRSDPPMPFSDIVALLATGRSPSCDYSTLMASPASPQSLQQMGASALLGQAIASPVTGRLQRFFGVTRLKIDPTLTSLTGVENNPQARLTIEQQVTPDITFTYITDVTSTNPLVIQVEWAVSRRWSAVALRDENGLVGLNFVYKRRF
jgi:translocation and assembly module TamB